jgi:hypothetical protein
MDSSHGRSVSVTIAAVAAILSSLLVLACCGAAFLIFLLVKLPNSVPEYPPPIHNMMLGIQAFMICLSLFGIATGIGLLYLHNWARISTLIWGGMCAFFGVIGTVFVLLIPLPVAPNTPELTPEATAMMRIFVVLIYLVPLAMGIWWLILFNLKSVKAQFASTAFPDDPSVPKKPSCPLPIAVLAWFYVASILNLLFLPFLPSKFPLFIFGIVLAGPLGRAILILSVLVFFACGIGLLKLKSWSYSLTIGLQLFWLASSAVSMLSPNYKNAMDSYAREIQASMHLPETGVSVPAFSQIYDWSLILGLIIAGGLLGMLVYYRPRFLEAVAKSASQ